MKKEIILQKENEEIIVNTQNDFLDEIILNETHDKLIAKVFFNNCGNIEHLEIIECNKIVFPETELYNLEFDKVKLRGVDGVELIRMWNDEIIKEISIKDKLINVLYLTDKNELYNNSCLEVGFY